jgi:hypothetical protein
MRHSRIKSGDVIIPLIPLAVAVWAIAGGEWDLAVAGVATSVVAIVFSLRRSNLPLADLVRRRGESLIVLASLTSLLLVVVVPFVLSGIAVVWKLLGLFALILTEAALFVIWYRSRKKSSRGSFASEKEAK